MDKLNEILNDVPKNNVNFFQIRHFIIGNQPTIQSKLWQCVLELQTRKENIESIQLQIEDSKDDIELLYIEKSNLENNNMILVSTSQEKEDEIKIRKINRNIENIKKNIISLQDKINIIKQEINYIIELYEELTKKEKIKPYNDENSQLKYWNMKLQEELNLRSVLQTPLDLELIKTILSLPDHAVVKQNTLNFLNKINESFNNKIEKK